MAFHFHWKFVQTLHSYTRDDLKCNWVKKLQVVFRFSFDWNEMNVPEIFQAVCTYKIDFTSCLATEKRNKKLIIESAFHSLCWTHGKSRAPEVYTLTIAMSFMFLGFKIKSKGMNNDNNNWKRDKFSKYFYGSTFLSSVNFPK